MLYQKNIGNIKDKKTPSRNFCYSNKHHCILQPQYLSYCSYIALTEGSILLDMRVWLWWWLWWWLLLWWWCCRAKRGGGREYSPSVFHNPPRGHPLCECPHFFVNRPCGIGKILQCKFSNQQIYASLALAGRRKSDRNLNMIRENVNTHWVWVGSCGGVSDFICWLFIGPFFLTVKR